MYFEGEQHEGRQKRPLLMFCADSLPPAIVAAATGLHQMSLLSTENSTAFSSQLLLATIMHIELYAQRNRCTTGIEVFLIQLHQKNVSSDKSLFLRVHS